MTSADVACSSADDPVEPAEFPNQGVETMAESALSLEEVAVTQLRPERFAEVLTPDGVGGVRAHARNAGASCSARTRSGTSTRPPRGRRGGDAALADGLHPRGGTQRVAGWSVEGDAEFFRITKRLHNRLHGALGDGGPLGEAGTCARTSAGARFNAAAAGADARARRCRDPSRPADGRHAARGSVPRPMSR